MHDCKIQDNISAYEKRASNSALSCSYYKFNAMPGNLNYVYKRMHFANADESVMRADIDSVIKIS